MLALIATAASILVFSGITSVVHFDWDKSQYVNPAAAGTKPPPTASVPATANLNNNGPHGFSEILYAYASTTGNNGSAFGGINPNTPLVQCDARDRDVDRAIFIPSSASGCRRKSGGEKEGCGDHRNLSDAWAIVCRSFSWDQW